MADFDTAQQAEIKEALAKADAIIANCRLKKTELEADEKLLVEYRDTITNSLRKRAEREALAVNPSAESFLTTSQWLDLISLVAAWRASKASQPAN